MSDEPNRPAEEEVEAHGPLNDGSPLDPAPLEGMTEDEEPDVEAHTMPLDTAPLDPVVVDQPLDV